MKRKWTAEMEREARRKYFERARFNDIALSVLNEMKRQPMEKKGDGERKNSSGRMATVKR